MKTNWLLKIEDNLKRDFKARCAQTNITMIEAAEEALNDWLMKKAECEKEIRPLRRT